MVKLQIALDNLDLEDALKSINAVSKEIDVIEVGTILHVSEGLNAVRELRKIYPDKIILSDIKAADAGSVLTKQCFDAGANWITVICCAELATMSSMLDTCKDYGKDHDVQVELYGDWTFDNAKAWYDIGLRQVVYHRSRDSQACGQKWNEKDLDKINKLCSMGFKVTVTGGLCVDDIKLFKELPIYCFIAGRSIRDAENPLDAAKEFNLEINKYYG
ncbi:MAG: 3-keto-L-gulonate-6-phosphate decarboxylase UlaD [Erysipelotrichaceae bacterium]